MRTNTHRKENEDAENFSRSRCYSAGGFKSGVSGYLNFMEIKKMYDNIARVLDDRAKDPIASRERPKWYGDYNRNLVLGYIIAGTNPICALRAVGIKTAQIKRIKEGAQRGETLYTAIWDELLKAVAMYVISLQDVSTKVLQQDRAPAVERIRGEQIEKLNKMLSEDVAQVSEEFTDFVPVLWTQTQTKKGD